METSSTPPPPPLPDQGSKWPKVIGIIAIILGALALLQAAMAPLMIPFTRKSMEASIDSDTDRAAIESYFTDLTSLSTFSAFAIGLISLLLLVGGIFLVKRNKLAVPLLLLWGVLKIVIGGYVNYRNYFLVQTQLSFVTPEMEGEAAEMMNNFTEISALIGLIGGTLWILVFPIFLMIWFSRAKVRAEVATW